MYESTKTKQVRQKDFDLKFLNGAVLDIGAGDDLVCPWAVCFDKTDGDANDMSTFFIPESFDTVHSSHALEHMTDPVYSLKTWWRLVKPGGYLVLVVPDEQLYEQDIWPSAFNSDHKASFRFTGIIDRSDSYNLKDLCSQLPYGSIVSYVRQDCGLRYSLLFQGSSKSAKRVNRLSQWIGRNMNSHGWIVEWALVFFGKMLVRYGYPIDQTLGGALAQIEIILQKKLPI